MMHDDPIALVGGVRTAIGRFGGALKDVEASDLGAACIREVISRVGIDPGEVDEVVMGQVAQVGPDAYNARRCALGAGLPPSSTAMNVNRLCSSGLQAIVSGAQSILSGQARVVVAGGDESMSRQPFLTYGERAGWRLGSREAIDGTLSLLTDPFGGYQMGVTAEKVAEQQDVSREQQDAFALRSQERAAAAIEEGRFERADRRRSRLRARAEPFTRDEHPRAPRWSSWPASSPSSRRAASVTAGNSSGINDGAAAVMLMRLSDGTRAWARAATAAALLGGDGHRARDHGLRTGAVDPEGARAAPARRSTTST